MFRCCVCRAVQRGARSVRSLGPGERQEGELKKRSETDVGDEQRDVRRNEWNDLKCISYWFAHVRGGLLTCLHLFD